MALAEVNTTETAPAPIAPTRERTHDWLPLTAHSVERVVGIEDPVLRNLWITQSYADLAARLLAAFETDQSWCSFATWASNTAGLSIREAELPHVLNALLRDTADHVDAIADEINQHHRLIHVFGLVRLGFVRTVQRTALGHLVEQALGQVSDFIADGNTLVYGELAPVFVRLAEWLENDDTKDPAARVDDILGELGVPSAHDHPLIHQAFDAYVRAAMCRDESQRAQFVLTANIAAVLHEQQRLQNDIQNALDAGLIDVGHDLEHLCHRLMPRRLRDWVVSRAKQRVAPHVTALWEHVATSLMMTLTVPGRTLHLGADVPPLDDGEMFPHALRHIDHAELDTLLQEWDPTHGTARSSAARDWADLHERMGYIVNLFRSRQQTLQLSTSPFSDLELATMRDGMVPRTI